MKKILFMAFVGLFALSMTSCKKDPTEKLIGTWNCHQEEDMVLPTDEGELSIHIALDADLNFVDDASGKMITTYAVSIMGMPMGDESMEQPFTYTFDGTTGTINVQEVVIEDPEEGSTTTYEAQTLHFTMVDDTHFTITEVDEDTGEPITLTFIKK